MNGQRSGGALRPEMLHSPGSWHRGGGDQNQQRQVEPFCAVGGESPA